MCSAYMHVTVLQLQFPEDYKRSPVRLSLRLVEIAGNTLVDIIASLVRTDPERSIKCSNIFRYPMPVSNPQHDR